MTTFPQNRVNDLRYALRMMRKSPGFSAVAIASLALGIGANTAIFTLVDAVLLKMLPVKDPKQLYVLATNDTRPGTYWCYPDYAAFRDHNRGFTGLMAYSSVQPYGWSVQKSGDQQAQLAYGMMVSGNYFEVLGVDTAAGRLLNPEDDRNEGAGPYIVISNDFWRRQFAMDPRAIGTSVRINGYPMTIVGVSRAGFTGVEVGVAPDFFTPIMMRTQMTGRGNWNNRYNQWISALGRLKPDASITQLESELFVIGKEMEDQDRRASTDPRMVNSAKKIKLLPGAQGYSALRNRLSQPLLVLMVIVGAVLLIACANVANLLLARAAARQHEIAVRLAIGASRARLGAQLLTESVLLGFCGGIAGLGFAYFGVKALIALMPRSGFSMVSLDVSPDVRLLAFTMCLSVLTGIVFGLAPALQSTSPVLVSALREETGSTATRSRHFLRKGLVMLQVALSLLLLIGAGLFVRSLQNLRSFDAGFRRENILLVDIDPSRNGYKGQRLRDYYDRLRERVERVPGVQTATLARITPLMGGRWNGWVSFPGYTPKPGERPVVDRNAISPGFLEAMSIPIVLGRDFRPEDNPAFSPTSEPRSPRAEPSAEELAGPHVVIINESAAKRFFPNQNPVGMRMSFSEKYRAEGSYEIVGVVKDAHYFGLRNATEGMIYQPVWRPEVGARTLCVRTRNDPQQMLESVRREANTLDSTVPILRARTMEQEVDNNILQEKLVALLSSFFGLLALLLAGVGLYGVVAHSVTQRTREIAIRVALGAERGSVLWLVLRDALAMVVAGSLIAIPAAMAVTKFASAFLYGVSPRDPFSMALATLVLLAIAVLASYLPARRASRVDPNVALRFQ